MPHTTRCKTVSHLLSIYALVSCLSGCTTTFESKPYKEKTNGQLYYLPAPFLAVTPKPDGTADVEILYLPDPKRAYVIEADSFLSSYKLVVETKNGMLTKLTLDDDSSATPNSLVDAAAKVADKKYEERKAKREGAATEKADAESREKELRKSALTAKAKLEQLQKLKQIDPYKNTITPQSLLAAEQALLEAKLNLAFFLEKDLSYVDSQMSSDSFDAPQATPNTAPGPVLFRIMMSSNDVKLVLVEGDFVVPTTNTTTPFSYRSLGKVPLTGETNWTHNMRFTKALSVLCGHNVSQKNADNTSTDVTSDVNVKIDGEKKDLVTVTFLTTATPGEYELTICVAPEVGSDQLTVTQTYQLIPSPPN